MQGTSFGGTLGNGTVRTYATVTQFNAAGQKERESYGTGTFGMTAPLYLKLHYKCESRVKAEQIEGCGRFSVAVNSQTFTGTNPGSILNAGFLHQPIEH